VEVMTIKKLINYYKMILNLSTQEVLTSGSVLETKLPKEQEVLTDAYE